MDSCSKKIVKILQNFNKNLKNIFLTKWDELSLFSAMKNMHIWAGRVLILKMKVYETINIMTEVMDYGLPERK